MDGKWEDEEVKSLFLEVERVKNAKRPLKAAFLLHANKFNRKPNSVRNYYYKELDELKEDKLRQKKLGIDLKKHFKQEIKYFSEKEGEKIVFEINKLLKEGLSVRQACLRLSGGDVGLMLRYQNKYRSTVKEPETKPVNILEFKNRQKPLSENDLVSLFLGLLRLVKKTAASEIIDQANKEKASLNFLLKKTILELNRKERENKILKEHQVKSLEEISELRNRLENKSLKQAILTEKLKDLRSKSPTKTESAE